MVAHWTKRLVLVSALHRGKESPAKTANVGYEHYDSYGKCGCIVFLWLLLVVSF